MSVSGSIREGQWDTRAHTHTHTHTLSLSLFCTCKLLLFRLLPLNNWHCKIFLINSGVQIEDIEHLMVIGRVGA